MMSVRRHAEEFFHAPAWDSATGRLGLLFKRLRIRYPRIHEPVSLKEILASAPEDDSFTPSELEAIERSRESARHGETIPHKQVCRELRNRR
ncbi:MAG: hypothetical protein M1319_05175 [Chloroflexi bacterium]|nr:hypothetical protein [Chloroflexota bacterium]